MRKKITITIWDELPLPSKVRNFPAMKHPLHKMLKLLEVNQALDWPRELKATANQLQAVMRTHEKATKKKFRFRTVWPKPWSKDDGPKFRIWRTA